MTVVQRIEAAYKRLERARELVKAGKVHKLVGDGEGWAVESSDGKRVYYVNGSCGCEDYRRHAQDGHGWWCKHRLAVEIYKSSKGGALNAQRNGARANRKPQHTNR